MTLYHCWQSTILHAAEDGQGMLHDLAACSHPSRYGLHQALCFVTHLTRMSGASSVVPLCTRNTLATGLWPHNSCRRVRVHPLPYPDTRTEDCGLRPLSLS